MENVISVSLRSQWKVMSQITWGAVPKEKPRLNFDLRIHVHISAQADMNTHQEKKSTKQQSRTNTKSWAHENGPPCGRQHTDGSLPLHLGTERLLPLEHGDDEFTPLLLYVIWVITLEELDAAELYPYLKETK